MLNKSMTAAEVTTDLANATQEQAKEAEKTREITVEEETVTVEV